MYFKIFLHSKIFTLKNTYLHKRVIKYNFQHFDTGSNTIKMICFRFKYLDLAKPIIKSVINILEKMMSSNKGGVVMGNGKKSQSKY